MTTPNDRSGAHLLQQSMERAAELARQVSDGFWRETEFERLLQEQMQQAMAFADWAASQETAGCIPA